MTTFAGLRTAIARDLRDPDLKTFTDNDIKDLVNGALATIGRIAPRRFQEDIVPVLNQMEYQLLSTDFSLACPEIEIVRVEVWDATQTPNMPIGKMASLAGAVSSFSNEGWRVWDGVLEVPYWFPIYVSGSEDDYLIRVWGYAPYVPLDADEDVCPLSNEREWALRSHCSVVALQRLSMERDLFSQWQTRSGNSDVSPAALLSALNVAQEEWRRLARAITVMRELPD
jgi:hypothetical protein